MTLEVLGLDVNLGGRRIVSGITLTVGDGRFVGLLGPNGSGKSTILKTIYRAVRPAGGQILLDRTDLLAMPARHVARRVAVVAQESSVDFDVTVWEMVMIGRTPHKQPFERDDDTDRAIVWDSIERVGCTDLAARSLRTLSGGEKQRVLIARALAQGADHLVLDEPTNHLDIRHQTEILELVTGLNLSVLAALHDLNLAALFCDTVHLLDSGRIVAAGPPRAVITTEAIEEVYGADVLLVTHPDTGTPHLLPRRTRDATPTSQARPPMTDQQ
jgi:iron complex transport system ATP-binding protein